MLNVKYNYNEIYLKSKKVKLTVKKDSSLLSGYKVTVGSWTLDDSAQFHLNKIKEDISKIGI